ncbi:MAG: hypothetical protein ACTHMI_08925 [Mucilaginibacter sp.]|uniref:hypothetical protein n=1 Tax=Mucilaginibacter sp. L3T2-6 TaxID=3062491 RepID=UPI0026748318|nr:hypothetical protein [Mucilaginibacter sp. L3T2-6]MDO3644917.1 hypothetical protein [Mucilaginibacter sp. L3T2-6]MDV6217368.1 hypothetical protein [Mucilaginibacter sp. L3T2-6]
MKRKVYQAIANPMRGMMLTLLTAGGTTPDTIAGQFGSYRQAVSKHILVPAQCGTTNQK